MQRSALNFLPVILPLALAVIWSRAAASEVPPVKDPDLDWRTSPLDLNLRGLNGERFRFHCPPGKPAPGMVTGTRLFADSSSICAAAVHAGALRPAQGGLVTIEIRPGHTGYQGTESHFVPSDDYAGAWSGSFIVVLRAQSAASPTPAAVPAQPLRSHDERRPAATWLRRCGAVAAGERTVFARLTVWGCGS